MNIEYYATSEMNFFEFTEQMVKPSCRDMKDGFCNEESRRKRIISLIKSVLFVTEITCSFVAFDVEEFVVSDVLSESTFEPFGVGGNRL